MNTHYMYVCIYMYMSKKIHGNIYGNFVFYKVFISAFYFQITPISIDLSERDAPKKIQVTSTVPIVCEDGTEDCRVLVELGQTNTDNFIDYCTLSFKPGPSGKTEELEVVAKRDFVDDGDQTMFLKIHIPDHIDPSDWNCYKNITSIKVTLLRWSKSRKSR